MLEIIRYITKKNHALDEFSTLVDLNLALGSKDLMPIRQSCRATYSHLGSVHELLEVLSESINDWMLPEIQNSMSFSIMMDEVSDSASLKNLAIVIKYVGPKGYSKMKFLANRQMARATGELIKDALLHVLDSKNISALKCRNITSDGGSNFAGKKNGAASLLKEIMGDVIIMHCHDHRLALAAKEAFSEIKVMDKVSEGLDRLYKFYKYSTVSSASLKQLQDVLNSAHWKVQQAKHHRWLSYDKSVLTVLKGHNILLKDLENSCASGELSQERQSEAQGLIVWLTSETVIKTLALLGDILPNLSQLSLLYQRKDVDLGSTDPVLKHTLLSMARLKTKPGFWGKKVEYNSFLIRKADCTDQKFEKEIKLPFLASLKEKLLHRFANSDTIDNLASLALPIQDPELMKNLPTMYKEEQIDQLALFFHLETNDTEGTTVEEWSGFLDWIKQLDIPETQRWDSSLAYIAQMFLDSSQKSVSLRTSFPNLAFLYSIAVTLTLSSAEVEPVFSHLKLIKIDRRSCLSEK